MLPDTTFVSSNEPFSFSQTLEVSLRGNYGGRMWEPMSLSPQRIVYSLWSLGHGYTGIKKLAIQTNIPNTNDSKKL